MRGPEGSMLPSEHSTLRFSSDERQLVPRPDYTGKSPRVGMMDPETGYPVVFQGEAAANAASELRRRQTDMLSQRVISELWYEEGDIDAEIEALLDEEAQEPTISV